jgi:ribulose kinase
MTEKGHVFDSIFICGGFANNKLYMQCHADITGLPVVLTDEKECVLLGSAMLAAAASTGHQLTAIMKEMATVNSSNVIYPKDSLDLIKYHNRKYQVYKTMYNDQYKYRQIMSH